MIQKSDPTYLRAVLQDYLRGLVGFETICRVWERDKSTTHQGFLNAGINPNEDTSENLDRFYQVMWKSPWCPWHD